MLSSRVIKVLMHLKKQGHKSLADKLKLAIKTGKPAHLTGDERRAYYTIRGEIEGTKALNNPISKLTGGFELRRELGMQPFQGNIIRKTGEYKGLGSGVFSRGVYGQQKRVPISDVDFHDPTSHAKDQVLFKTLKDFTPALKDFMKTKRGKQSALKIYRTPAGLRIFDVSKVSRGEKPMVYDEVWQALGGDPRFTGQAIRSGQYATRLHPKPGRKTNIWNLEGNVQTGKFAKQNPGDFVAQQRIPGSIIKGPDAIIDPKSLSEVQRYHDGLVKLVLQNKLKTGNISLSGLLKYIDMTTL